MLYVIYIYIYIFCLARLAAGDRPVDVEEAEALVEGQGLGRDLVSWAATSYLKIPHINKIS